MRPDPDPWLRHLPPKATTDPRSHVRVTRPPYDREQEQELAPPS